jgi:hypothetical protein
MTDAVQELLRTGGILAPIVILFGWYILNKDRELKEVRKELSESQEARTADAKAITAELINLNDKWMAAINANTQVMNSNTQVMSDIKGIIARDSQSGYRGRRPGGTDG